MLYGRSAEQAELDRLVAAARTGNSGVLVVLGQPGIGKSALLDHAAAQATRAETRTLRGVGIESEAELPYAALHLLLHADLHHIDALPSAQADALRGALGLGAMAPENRFLVGLATLSLLAEIAGDGSLLCLIDDAQWFDQASIDALLFAARRLHAEGIAMVFAARDGFRPRGLPELELRGVDRTAAAALLAERAGELSPQVRELIMAEADGNPLALLELPSAQLGPFAPETAPLAGRVQEAFRSQIQALPATAQALLTVMAADDTGALGIVLRAAEGFGAGVGELEVAELARLIVVDAASVRFRHPLIRAAAYLGAPLTQRLAVRHALASVLDGPEHADRRAWHLATAATRPDESVASELERAAERAGTRSGYAAMAAAYERAAELTPDPAQQSVRQAAAALAASNAGLLERAAALADRASEEITDAAALAGLTQVRAHLEFEQGTPAAAGRIIVEGADRVAPLNAERAAYLLVEALRCAWLAADQELAQDAAARLRALPEIDSPLVGGVLGLAKLVGGDDEGGIPLVRELVDSPDLSSLGVPGLLLTAQLCVPLGRFSRSAALADQVAAQCRTLGMDGWLAHAVQEKSRADTLLGRYGTARAALEEIRPTVIDLRLHNRVKHIDGLLAFLAAELGEESTARAKAAESLPSAAAWALGRLELALGHPDRALKHLESSPTHLSAPDQVEAAMRSGQPDRAVEPLERYVRWAALVSQPSSDAVALRCRALVEGEEEGFARAVHLHGRGDQSQEQARTQLLYGEWLRRARRRADARAQLREALEIFDRLGAALWAERARAELRATGDVPAAPRVADDPLSVLTAQERQVVQLAATGASNRDIAAQLFLSPRTVGYHLYKAFPKLGISSRAELRKVSRG